MDQTVDIPIQLDIGTVAESVRGHGRDPPAGLRHVVTRSGDREQEDLDLPLNGRNAFALGLLAGNTVPVSGMGTNLPFVAGGGRFSTNDVMLDGIDNNTSVNQNSIGRNGINYTPSVDAVAEFKVKTNNYSAEFGRSAGAIISANLKSGGNDFHGSAWEFLRNEKLDANNFFSNAAGVARQPFKQNQFGFTLGGPVLIPGVYNGHNKTFFFTDYEGLRRRTSASSNILDIPPLDYRKGDFSRYRATIYDPRTRRMGPDNQVIADPFPNNIIPPSLLFPVRSKHSNLLPAPNFGAPGADARNYIRIASNPNDNNQYDIKVDQRIGEKNTLFGRFSRARAAIRTPVTSMGLSAAAASISATRLTLPSVTHIYSRRLS